MESSVNLDKGESQQSDDPMVDSMNMGYLMQAFEIFVRNKWTEHKFYKTALQNFTTLLLNLTESQRDLILELVNKYRWLSMNEIYASLTDSLDSVNEEILKTCKRIYVFPIMKPEDQDKIKSGHSAIYSIRGARTFLEKYQNIDFVEIIKYEEIRESSFQLKQDELLYLVDDYLGSGETVETTLKLVLDNRSIDISKIKVIAVAAQEETVRELQKFDIPVHCSIICKKGITGCYSDEEVRQKIDLMLEIERLISINRSFSLGYNKSEALITLTRTPDNTFPIFWKSHRKAGKKYKAPFPRD